MPVIERDCGEHVHWHPYVTVEKYSPDQAAFAEHRLADSLTWKRMPLLRKIPLGETRGPVVDGEHAGTWRRHRGDDGIVRRACDPNGDWLRELFPHGPEDGYAHDDGNLLTNQGLANIIFLLLAGYTGAAANQNIPLTNAHTVCGVGSSSTAATTADTHLNGDGSTTTAYYQQMDVSGSGYPTLTVNATINGQCTYASGVANFAWNEWGWVTGGTYSAAGGTLSSVYSSSTTTALINHKVPASSLGTKASGASWVFSTTIVFS